MSRIAPYIPSDPLFGLQWHLLNRGNTPGSVAGHDINVVSVWPDYTGRGVLIGIQDDGMDDTHPDLVSNYRPELAWDLSWDQAGATARNTTDAHGAAVAGLAAAAGNNGIGGTGVAWGSQFTMYRLDFARTKGEALLHAVRSSAEKKIADGIAISSNSWGLGAVIDSDFLAAYHEVFQRMAEDGRQGLGTVTVFAAGNDRMEGMNTNYNPTSNSPWTIVVAASHQSGGVTGYSTPGASVLITAPGSGARMDPPASMVTTDRQGVDGYNKAPGVAGNYEYSFNGTSAATPVAAGVVALILEANARLGYRDVQEILAYSADRAGFIGSGFDHAFNGARDWNGGALLASHDFGYGHIDAHAAVRLAESWMKTSTASNLVMEEGQVIQPTLTVSSGQEGRATASFAPDHRVEQVSVTVSIAADDMQGLTLQLISPDGMASTLFRGLPKSLVNSAVTDDDDDEPDELNYTFNTVLNWGSGLAGEWSLKLSSAAGNGWAHLKDWSITAYTAGNVAGGTQIFTDEFARFAELQPERILIDAADGSTLNAAAVTGDIRFDLASGVSWLGESELSLVDTSAFRNLIAGDGNDILIGNQAGNIFMAGRGNNHVDGGGGVDIARLIGDYANYGVDRHDDVVTVRSHTLAGGGVDVLYNVELLHFQDRMVLTRTPTDLGPDLFDEAAYLSQNADVHWAVLSGQLQSGRQHYAEWGAAEGRNPNVLFDERWYLANNADVAQAVGASGLASGYQHYVTWGWAEGRKPSAWMDTTAYLAANPDVAAAHMGPLQHYLLHGIHEGRSITALATDMWV